MRNVSDVKNCYGCGICSVACGNKIISIEMNSKGFYVPIIMDQSKCTECGLCMTVCSFINGNVLYTDKDIHCFAAWSKNLDVRHKCSSGGVGFEIGRLLLKKGYKVCGVRYNVDIDRAEHYVASSVNDLMQSIGSKYIQSYTVNGLKNINKKDKYLVIGTPCQIDSLRRYIRKFHLEDNFILMDFFCHGVPSYLAWKKYLDIEKIKTGKVNYVSWRNKRAGWHDSWAMLINGDKRCVESRLSQGNIFYKLYLGNFCMNIACRKDCKYKYNSSAADIRICDFWGNTYKEYDDGVSGLVVYTAKGNDVVANLEDCELTEHSFEVVSEGQMRKNCDRAYLSLIAEKMIKSKHLQSRLSWEILFRLEDLLHIPKRVVNKAIRIITHLKQRIS